MANSPNSLEPAGVYHPLGKQGSHAHPEVAAWAPAEGLRVESPPTEGQLVLYFLTVHQQPSHRKDIQKVRGENQNPCTPMALSVTPSPMGSGRKQQQSVA